MVEIEPGLSKYLSQRVFHRDVTALNDLMPRGLTKVDLMRQINWGTDLVRGL